MPEPTRCVWAGSEPLMVAYHDDEWGVPTHDDAALFELLTLEGAQAGLSWRTILRSATGYRAAFAGFDVDTVARFTDADVDRLRAATRPSSVTGARSSRPIEQRPRHLGRAGRARDLRRVRVGVRRRHADRRHVACTSTSCPRSPTSRPR